jgi:SH3-like domain-containing protein
MTGAAARRLLSGAAALLLIARASLAAAPPPTEDSQGLKIPRFVSVRLGEVNLRVGPGQRYPIAWVLTRKDMPVEVVEEFDTWRKIRDFEGTEGWVNHAALSGKRSVIITGEVRVLRSSADAQASPVARLEPGVIAKLLECAPDAQEWCRIEVNDVRGWLHKGEFWGIFPQEVYPQ